MNEAPINDKSAGSDNNDKSSQFLPTTTRICNVNDTYREEGQLMRETKAIATKKQMQYIK